MIHLIQGRSGSGKTRYLYAVLSDLAKNGAKRLLYLIPEQSSFECETRFLRELGPSLSRRISVMSFTRLYDMVMTATGGARGTPIDDSVRKLIMSCTLEDCVDKLDLYAKPAQRPQFTEAAISAIKELKQCGIMPDELRRAAVGMGGELENKLRELSFIYDVYNANVERSGVDPFDNDMRLEKRIAETDFFKDYTIAVDDFSGFTAQQQKILDLMTQQASDLYISLCMDALCQDELFFTVNRTKTRIIQSARGMGIDKIEIIRMNKNERTNSDALMFLEENIYRRTPLPDDAAPANGDVTLVSASDIYNECEYTAARIKELAVSGQCRYRDIAVVFRKSDDYEGILADAFAKYGVPCFISKPQPVDSKPLMRLVTSALEYVCSPNDEEKLLTAAKSGLFGLTPYSLAQLENYVFVWDIKGRGFYDEFTKHPQGFTESFSDEDLKLLGEINEAREAVAAPFSRLLDALTTAGTLYTAREISEAVYYFLVDCGVPELIREQAQAELEFSDEQTRLWDMLCDILNKMHVALGERMITVKRYTDLFKMVIKGADIADIPQTLDQVLVGKADSIRMTEPFAVFVIGAVMGEFPHMPVPDGVFNDIERNKLIEMGLPLYDCVTDLFRQERFFVYNAVSAPTDKLWVSFPRSSLSGETSEPSTIITDIMRIFPTLECVDSSTLGDIEYVGSDRTALERYAKGFSGGGALSDALGEYLKDTQYAHRLDSLGAPIKNMRVNLSDKRVCTSLFGKDKYLSASQVENFYQCRFKYFCNNGIRLRDRRKADLDKLVYGNIVHYLLENIIKAYIARDGAPFSDEELSALLQKLLDSYIKEYLGGEGSKTEKFMHMYQRSKDRIRRVVDNMLEGLADSKYRPVDTELEISGTGNGIPVFELETGSGKVVINGKVDRVDMSDVGEIRVIDYKTSGKTFSIADVLNGLNMQMLIYLLAIVNNGEKRYGDGLSPAAVMYMRSDLGVVSIDPEKFSDKDISELSKKEIKAKLKPNGIEVDEAKLNNPKTKKKDKNGIITLRQMEEIFSCVEDRLRQMSRELDGGQISAVPIEDSNRSACKWCDFNDICRREKTDRARTVSKKEAEELMNRTQEGGSGDE